MTVTMVFLIMKMYPSPRLISYIQDWQISHKLGACTFNTPAWTKHWLSPQAEAFPGLVSLHWHSELQAGSVSDGYNQSSPEWFPQPIHRFPAQQGRMLFEGRKSTNTYKSRKSFC